MVWVGAIGGVWVRGEVKQLLGGQRAGCVRYSAHSSTSGGCGCNVFEGAQPSVSVSRVLPSDERI